MTPSSEQDELLKLCDEIIAAEELLKSRKPTIEELERILQTPDSEISVSLNPDGSLNATSKIVVIARALRSRLSSPSVPDGWILAMQVLQSDLYHKLDDEERSICDALIAQNPYAKAQPPLTPSRSVHSKSEYRRLSALGVNVEPPSHHSGAVVNVSSVFTEWWNAYCEQIGQTYEFKTIMEQFARVAALEFYARRQRHPSSTGAEDLYHELIYAVGKKFPGESRHQTALRYIRQCENTPSEPAQEKHS